jgi:type III restriction enzyme
MAQTTLKDSRDWLYKEFENNAARKVLQEIEIPKEITNNLNQNLKLREYQKEAFKRFLCYFENSFDLRKYPSHLLYNMATGSGKTLIMAGLMLYLFKKGYNNFLFFVNSNNIIEKTKDNFLDPNHIKYLFGKKIVFDGKEINIRKVNDFTGTNKNEINICFTTIHKLHNDLNLDKENSITLNYFNDKKIVLLSDESHHGQAKTKQKTLEEERNWETTIKRIFEKNSDNILLEFTATMGIDQDEYVKEKYKNKLIFKYDLIDFRNDGFSKEPEIFKVDEDKKYRILTAILINQYRQDIAQHYASKFKDSENLTNFKPVILFKATKTIEDSKENEKLFNEIIDNLTKKDLKDIRDRIDHPIIKKLFDFYNNVKKISLDNLIKYKLKENFSKKHCINVNEENLDNKNIKKDDEAEIISQQTLLNSLEDKNNKIRVIFAVQKLNEGWDVLNLYDIVRISEKQASGGGTVCGISKTTISEAQLVGRGVRYFPFKIDPSEEDNLRKYDDSPNHDLRILEELFFHCHPGDKGRYIAELKKAFEREGLGDTGLEDKELNIKDSFKKTSFYKTAKIYVNRKVLKDTSKINSFSDLGFTKEDITYGIYSGKGEISMALSDENYDNSQISREHRTIKISEIEPHIIKNAIAKVFEFGNDKNGLKKYLPAINSINELLEKKEFLKDLKIDFRGSKNDLNNLSNKNKLNALVTLLENIRETLKGNYSKYEGSKEFHAEKAFGEIKDKRCFKDKIIRVKKNSERSKGHQEYISNKEWYVFDANYGTDQEKYCVEFIGRLIQENRFEDYKEIYLVRNELEFPIYNFDNGDVFYPDFILFMKLKNGKDINYQIFIEPKGGHITKEDKWKEDFLKKIKDKAKVKDLTKYENKEFKIMGVRFYNKSIENDFGDELLESVV